jgi:hypothetical protein
MRDLFAWKSPDQPADEADDTLPKTKEQFIKREQLNLEVQEAEAKVETCRATRDKWSSGTKCRCHIILFQ